MYSNNPQIPVLDTVVFLFLNWMRHVTARQARTIPRILKMIGFPMISANVNKPGSREGQQTFQFLSNSRVRWSARIKRASGAHQARIKRARPLPRVRARKGPPKRNEPRVRSNTFGMVQVIALLGTRHCTLWAHLRRASVANVSVLLAQNTFSR